MGRGRSRAARGGCPRRAGPSSAGRGGHGREARGSGRSRAARGVSGGRGLPERGGAWRRGACRGGAWRRGACPGRGLIGDAEGAVAAAQLRPGAVGPLRSVAALPSGAAGEPARSRGRAPLVRVCPCLRRRSGLRCPTAPGAWAPGGRSEAGGGLRAVGAAAPLGCRGTRRSE